MLYQDIYAAAVQLISEDPSAPDTEDYERRAPYLLGTITAQLAPIDKLYRQSQGEEAPTVSTALCVELNDPWLLSDRFSSAATYYLAAMLVMDENEKLGDRIFALYADEIATVQASLPAKCQSILDRYNLLI